MLRYLLKHPGVRIWTTLSQLGSSIQPDLISQLENRKRLHTVMLSAGRRLQMNVNGKRRKSLPKQAC